MDRPSGPCPVVVGTRLSITDIVRLVRGHDGSLAAAAEYLSVDPLVVEAGMRYYEHHREEVETRMREENEYSDRAYREWLSRTERDG